MTTRTRHGMKHSRTSWVEKLRPEMRMKVVADPRQDGQLLVPTPLLVAEEIKAVPQGALITFRELRDRLATRFKADHTCPLTTGIFFNILAGIVEEEAASGHPPIAPYRRVEREDGTISPKTPFGPERQAKRLRAEGHSIAKVRGTLRVKNYEPQPAKAGGSTKRGSRKRSSLSATDHPPPP